MLLRALTFSQAKARSGTRYSLVTARCHPSRSAPLARCIRFTDHNNQITKTQQRRSFAAASASFNSNPSSDVPLRSRQKNGPLRKYINQFLLLVHPDHFHGRSEMENTNQESLKKLNLILDELNQLANGSQAAHGTIPRNATIEFYLKPSHINQPDVKKISEKFHLPNELFSEANGNVVDSVQRAVHEHLRILLAKAGIDAPWNDQADAAAEAAATIAAAAAEKKQKARKQANWYVTELQDAEQGFHEALAQYTLNGLDHDADDPQGLEQVKRHELQIIASRNTFFDARLSRQQKRRAERYFRSALSSLRYHLWSRVPIMFTLDKWSDQKRGWAVVPWDFTLRDLKLYLVNEIDRLRAEQEGNHVACSNIVTLSDQVVEQLPCLRVMVSLDVPPAAAAAALERILTCEYMPAKGLVWAPPVNLHVVIAPVTVFEAKYYKRDEETYWLIPPQFTQKQLCEFFDGEMRRKMAPTLASAYKVDHGSPENNLEVLSGKTAVSNTSEDLDNAVAFHLLEPELKRQAEMEAKKRADPEGHHVAVQKGLLPQRDIIENLQLAGADVYGLNHIRKLRVEAERRLAQVHPNPDVRSGKTSLFAVEKPAEMSPEEMNQLDFAKLFDPSPLDVAQLRRFWAGTSTMEKLTINLMREIENKAAEVAPDQKGLDDDDDDGDDD